jgi:hypothetical protein
LWILFTHNEEWEQSLTNSEDYCCFSKGLALAIEKYFLANKKQALIEFQL